MTVSAPAASVRELPWYRQVDRVQWRAFFATFLGWVLDGFDFTILTFILVDIQKTFGVNTFMAGMIGTATLVTRLVGGVLAGAAADRWGRKPVLMSSILWFSVFACLSGFSSSYGMLLACRALFGIGMGGEWAAGMPLTLEHWPPRLRGIASGLLQSGFGWGFILSALTFAGLYPRLEHYGELAWRSMLWLGIGPALLVLWIRLRVPESPVWLAQRRHPRERSNHERVARLLQKEILLTTLHASLLMAAFMISFHALTYWYATFLREASLPVLPYVVVFNLGAIGGSYVCGLRSESRWGRRGTAGVAAAIAVCFVPLYLFSRDPWLLGLGALLIGSSGGGMWGVVPAYLIERFPTAVRSIGAGFAYHTGAALGAFTPAAVGALRDDGWHVSSAMGVYIVAGLVLVIVMLWIGPETRGRLLRVTEG